MDSSRRSFDRSGDPGVKSARISDDPRLRDPRLLNSSGGPGGVVRGVRAQPVDVRYMQIDREDEVNDSNGEGYHPTHQFSELVSEYRIELAELTINSKPIITNLTIIAGKNLQAAMFIAEAICNHIIEVPSKQKLPSLYLLDSIVKNIGRDYITYFSTRLPEVFCKAYKQADPSIQARLRHLFKTWEGVFPLLPLQMIEKELGMSLAVNGSGSVSARSTPKPQSQYPQKGIHVNPKYLEARQKLQSPSRAEVPTNAIMSTGSAARLGPQHREPVRDSMYEKDTEVAFDNHDLSSKKSSIGEHDNHWYVTGNNMPEPDTVLGQRNGYDGKHKLESYVSPSAHVSTPTDPRKDNTGFDEPHDMETDSLTLPAATTFLSQESADYARVLGVTSAGLSSSVGRKAMQPQMIRNPVTGASARSQANNSPGIVRKRPPASSQMITPSKNESLSTVPDLSSNNVSADNSSKEPEVKNLIGFEFKSSLIIRQLHESVIEDLSDGLPFRCNICGLRLKLQERLDKHMEWHSSKELDNDYGTLRRWFPDLDDWVAGISSDILNGEDSTEETEEASPDEECCLVPADEKQCICIICGELFEDYYSHEKDGWMFRGAMRVQLSDTGYDPTATRNNNRSQELIVHSECFSESSALELGLVAKDI